MRTEMVDCEEQSNVAEFVVWFNQLMQSLCCSHHIHSATLLPQSSQYEALKKSMVTTFLTKFY